MGAIKPSNAGGLCPWQAFNVAGPNVPVILNKLPFWTSLYGEAEALPSFPPRADVRRGCAPVEMSLPAHVGGNFSAHFSYFEVNNSWEGIWSDGAARRGGGAEVGWSKRGAAAAGWTLGNINQHHFWCKFISNRSFIWTSVLELF